jgi:NADH-quinone oxidoreductase subunit F
MDITKLINEAAKEWTNLLEGPVPAFLVGNATCGRSAGANKIIEKLNTEILSGNYECKVLEVGCIGMCYLEPIVSVYRPGYPVIVYGNVEEKDVAKMTEAFLNKGEIINENIIGVIGKGEQNDLPDLFNIPVMKPQKRLVLNNCGIIDPTNLNHYIANKG